MKLWPFDKKNCPACGRHNESPGNVDGPSYYNPEKPPKVCLGSIWRWCHTLKPHFHRRCDKCGHKFLSETFETITADDQKPATGGELSVAKD